MDELRRVRRERGISQAELAVQSGVDRSTISQIESGSREPEFSTLRKLAAVLNVKVGELLPIEEALPRVRGLLEELGKERDRIRRDLYEETGSVPHESWVAERLRRELPSSWFEAMLDAAEQEEPRRDTGV